MTTAQRNNRPFRRIDQWILRTNVVAALRAAGFFYTDAWGTSSLAWGVFVDGCGGEWCITIDDAGARLDGIPERIATVVQACVDDLRGVIARDRAAFLDAVYGS